MKVKITATAIVDLDEAEYDGQPIEVLSADSFAGGFEMLVDELESNELDDEHKITVEKVP